MRRQVFFSTRARRLGITALVTLIAGAARAQPLAPREFADEVEFGEWVTYYYRKPEPGRLPAAIEYYVGSSLFANEKGRIPLAQFAAEILGREAHLVDDLFERASSDGAAALRAFTLHVLWFVETDASRARLEEAGATWGDAAAEVVQQMKDETPTDLFSSRISSDVELDRLWAIFLATGGVAPVEKVAATLAWETRDPEVLLIRDAARWSLLSNALQHERVRRYLAEIARRAEGGHAVRLGELLAEIDAQASEPRDEG